MHEYAKADKKFKSIFGVSIKLFYDDLLSSIYGKIIVDMVAFDDYLYEKYENEYIDGVSMEDIIRLKYGEEGIETFFDFIPTEQDEFDFIDNQI